MMFGTGGHEPRKPWSIFTEQKSPQNPIRVTGPFEYDKNLEPDGHLFINGCFSWMMNQTFIIQNGGFTISIHLKLVV